MRLLGPDLFRVSTIARACRAPVSLFTVPFAVVAALDVRVWNFSRQEKFSRYRDSVECQLLKIGVGTADRGELNN